MRKNVLIKIILLVVGLSVIAAIAAVTIRSSMSAGAAGGVQSKTLFEQFVVAGGWVVWFVLLPMSMAMVYLAVEHGLTINRKNLLPDGAGKVVIGIIQQFGAGQLGARLSGRDDLVSVAVARAATQCGGDLIRMRSLLAESLQEQAMVLFRKIEWTNIIGNVSPMVGLFGTVLGIIKMFNAMAMAGGQPHASQLAGGISVALVTTFWGLMIAIPALTIHGVFQNRIETIVSEAAVEGEKLIGQIGRILKEQKRIEQPKTKQSIVEIPTKLTEAFDASSFSP
jgi:biopolymer transport protein ExbB